MVMLLGVLVACGGSNEPADTTKAPTETTGGNGTQDPGTQAPGTNDPATPGTNDPATPGTNDPANPGTQDPGTQDPSTGGATTLPPVPQYTPSVDPVDFGDADGNARNYVTMVRNSRWAWFDGTKDSKDVVSLAAYKRNQKLNEMYNINMSILEGGTDKADWRTNLDAADGNIDLAIPDFWWELEYEGWFINLMRRGEINDAESHWIQGWNNNIIINNRLYTITGDAALELMENWEVIFYNRDMAKDLGYYEALIDMVENDEWTVKEMMAIMDDFELALMDNDESNDIWGAVYDSHSIAQALYAAGLTLLETNRFTHIINDISNTPKNVNLTADVTALRHHGATKYFTGTARTELSEKNGLFFENKSFFFASHLLNGKAIKAGAPFDYGVMIMPKYDVADDYVTGSYGVSFFAIPHSASDHHVSTVVLNTMNWLSNTEDERGMGEDRLVYTYFETVVKGEVANLPEDLAMLDRIKNSARYDFGFVVSGTVGLQGGFTKAVANNESITVTIGEVAKKAEDGILEMMTYYGDPNTAE